MTRPLLALATAAAILGAACGGKTDARTAPPAGTTTTGDTASGARPLLVLVRAADWMGSEWSEDAIKFGLRESGLEPDRDYALQILSAQGDLATLPSLLDRAVDAKARVIIALQDPTLQAAVGRVKDVPVVFHLLADPFAVGAGTSDSSHLPNVTGVYALGFGDPAQSQRIALVKRVVPGARRLGILFTPAEELSVHLTEQLATAAGKAGLQVLKVPVNEVGEVSGATQSLCDRKVDAIEFFGNVAHAGFESLIGAARACRAPVFSSSPFEILKGASASLYPDFQEGGVVAGKMIARILQGESPASIPFYHLRTTHTVLGAPTARAR